ncbi:glycosyltransferase family 4 protein [Endozoicomonas sp. YOMI1]|uniref:glycosyltransferase family 4 protein n=1 Tax=Endozoicomonas sp. YOMI1 TaxID=2828739 RepID=UPI0021495B33|nr:glycosyltransferase family 4 protein [Endozoicomonas sp. YOMI1]
MAIASSNVSYELATIMGEGPWCDWVRSYGIQPLVFGKYGKGGMFGSIARLLRHLAVSPVDVLYVCGLRASLWLRSFRFLFPKTKIIHGIRWNPDSNSRLDIVFRLVERSTRFLVTKWITNSVASKRTLVQRCGIDDTRIHVIYNGINTVPKGLPVFDNRPLEVLTIANLNPRKGHREFLQVIPHVLQYVPNAHFVFIGRDDMNGTVQQAIYAAGLQDSVCYKGFQSDVTPWLKRARIFVLPSLWGEGCPTSILEAFSFGVPVVSHAIDGVPELIDDGRDGYLLPVDDIALADRIVELLLNPCLAEKMGQLGRIKVSDRFILASCVNQHEAVYREMVEN